ncbi:hypothetical protein GpartN1_g1580.t1 [Galdieria partita]|uniref:Uncharacterized protein n=1 Tax=Galdieria partita TaxID=83374 RepID=A0A9C7UNC7_9RHOD|nr:hypothetical protein GpartN1_g1580.t1 [Galdieria partita]
MFNALVSLILFCTLWCKLYNLGIQVQRQSVESNSGNRDRIDYDLNLPKLTFEDKVTWRAQVDETPKKQKDCAYSTKTDDIRGTARTSTATRKIQQSTSFKDGGKIRKPQTQRRKHKVESMEKRNKNETIPLSKRLRAILEELEEDDRKEETKSSANPEWLQLVQVSSPKKVETPSERKTLQDERIRVTPPSLNKRRRLLISDQRGLSFLLEPSIVSRHIYDQRISSLYQQKSIQSEPSEQTEVQKEGSNEAANAHIPRDISKEQVHQSNLPVVDHKAANASDIQSNTNVTVNTFSNFTPSFQAAVQSSPSLPGIAFQSGQNSQSLSKQRRVRHRR